MPEKRRCCRLKVNAMRDEMSVKSQPLSRKARKVRLKKKKGVAGW